MIMLVLIPFIIQGFSIVSLIFKQEIGIAMGLILPQSRLILDLYVIIKDCIVIYNSLKKRHIPSFHCKDENVRISVIFLVAKCFA